MLRGKALEDIAEADIHSLIDNQVREDRYIEFKEALPDNKSSAKRKFLATVSSFANTDGGDIVYGVKEKRDEEGNPTGESESVCGVAADNEGLEQQRLSDILDTGLDPRIQGVGYRFVPTNDGATVLVIRVPRSWAGPHMITLEQWSRFYFRDSSGKRPMGVHELRNSFLRAETLSERLRAFRSERIDVLNRREGPVQVCGGPRLLLHLVPLIAFDPGTHVDLGQVHRDYGKLAPLGSASFSGRHNFDGFLTYDGGAREGAMTGYAQLFRNGVIEAADTTFGGLIRKPHCIGERRVSRVIHGDAFECLGLPALGRYLTLQETLGIPPPCAVMLSLANVRGAEIQLSDSRQFRLPTRAARIDREELLVPQLLIEDRAGPLDVSLRPAFDAIWNACGYPRSPNYGDDGTWRQR